MSAPRPAEAAPLTWYRTGADAGGGYHALADAPGSTSYATSIGHGASTGSYRFRPTVSGSTVTGSPTASASGDGYATPTKLSGTIPAGTWSFVATVRTDVPSGTTEGSLALAVHAIGSGGASRLLTVVTSSTNVLSGPGERSVTLSTSLPSITLRDERIATEWYLVVSTNRTSASGSSTSLRHGAAGDTVTIPGPPSAPTVGAPGTLTVTGVGDNRISLQWGPSGDSRVTGYVVRRATGSSGPWTDVATVSGTTFTDSGLVNGTRYYHSVVAVAADGTRSSPSNATSAVPTDVTSPPAPGTPGVVPAGSFQLQVSWPASTGTDVVGYEVQRSGATGGPYSRIAGPVGGTSFTDTGLPSGSTWYYRIVAIDDDGLRSAPTAPAAGTVAPSPPSGLRVAAVADGAVALEWSGVAGAAEYVLERATGSGAFSVVARPAGTSHTDGNLTNGTTYRYRVRAVDAAGAVSSPSGTVQATPQDTGLPAPPTGLTASPKGANDVRLSWTRSASASTVGYRVFRAAEGGSFTAVSGLVTGTVFDDGPLAVGVPYRYQVVAEDASGVRSIPASTSYTVAPSAPRNLRVGAVSETTVQLLWDATNDPRAGYRVLRAPSASGPYTAVSGLLKTTSFTDGGLTLGEEYHYVVQAEAVDGTRSPSSNAVRVVPVNGPPTPPTGLIAADTGAGGQISLSWAANPEPDVSRYRVERSSGGGWSTIATTASTTYLDSLLIDGRSYSYRIVAIDTALFTSAPSDTATATPTDSAPPAAPGLPAVRQFGTALQVQWPPVATAETYLVVRSTSPTGAFTRVGTVSGSRSFVDENVSRGVTYYYAVQAQDAAGNVSPTSAVASGQVQSIASFPTDPSSPTPGLPGGGTGGGTTDGPVASPIFPDPFGQERPSLRPDGSVSPGGQDGGLAAPQPQDDPSGNPFAPGGNVSVGPPSEGEIDLSSGARSATDAFRRGNIPEALGRTAQDVAQNVQEVAETFRIPLILLLILAIYLVVQGRIDRSTVVVQPEAATGGEDDDVEYLL